MIKREKFFITKCSCCMVDTFLQLSCKVLAHFLPVKEGKLLKDLNENFMVKRELGMIAGDLSLKYGGYMAIASAALLIVKSIEVPFKSVNDKEIDNIS